MINKIFNILSYSRFVAYIWGGYIAFPELIERSENVLANIGLGIFLFGIGLSLEGFKDPDRPFTKSEIKLFTKQRKTKVGITINALFQCFAILIGIFCFNLDLFYPEEPAWKLVQFHDIGYGSLAVGVGGINIAKEQYNRFKAYTKSQKQ